MDGVTYPFQVSIWMKEEPALKLLGQAHWLEVCRCKQEWQAKEIAKCLAIHNPYVQVAQFMDDRFIPYYWIPDNPQVD